MTDLAPALAGPSPVARRSTLAALVSTPWRLWCAVRVVGVLAALTAVTGAENGTGLIAGDVLVTYYPVHQGLFHGQLPYVGQPFPYPPGALLGVVLPPVPLSAHAFLVSYVLVMLGVDALVHRSLLRSTGATTEAARLWTVGGGLLLGLPLVRNDLIACLGLVACVPLLVAGRRRGAAAWGTVGVLAKVWPVVVPLVWLTATTERFRLRRGHVIAAVAVVAAAGLAAAVGVAGAVWKDVISFHADRGVQVESLFALPRLVPAALTGRSVDRAYDHGSDNLVGSGGLALASTIATVAVLAGVLFLVRRARGRLRPDDALVLGLCVLVTGMVVTAKVLSPQYLLWVLAVASVAELRGHADRGARALLYVACALTTLDYPFLYEHIGRPGGLGLLVLGVLLLRDACLVALTVVWCRRLVRRSS